MNSTVKVRTEGDRKAEGEAGMEGREREGWRGRETDAEGVFLSRCNVCIWWEMWVMYLHTDTQTHRRVFVCACAHAVVGKPPLICGSVRSLIGRLSWRLDFNDSFGALWSLQGFNMSRRQRA